MARPTLEEYLLKRKEELGRPLTDEETLITKDEYHRPEQTRDKQRTDELERQKRYNLRVSRGRWASEEKHKKYIELLEKYGTDEDINEAI